MNRRAVAAFAVLCLIGAPQAGFSRSKAAPKKQRIAVLDFEDKSGHSYHWRNVGQGMAEMLTTSLFGTGKFIVVERDQLGKIMAEQRLGASGALTAGTAAKIGRLIGAGFIVTGSVTEFGMKESKLNVGNLGRKFGFGGGGGIQKQSARCALDLRFIDTSSGQIVAAEKAEGSDSAHSIRADVDILPSIDFGKKGFDETTIGKATREAIEKSVKLVEKHVAEVPWFGRIVKMQGGTFLINTGEEDGREIGDTFRVERASEELVDPDTGESLGSEVTKIGVIKIVAVKGKKLSAAEAVEGSGFQEGDKILE